MFDFEYFQDKRYRRERLTWAWGLALALLAGLGFVVMQSLPAKPSIQEDARNQNPTSTEQHTHPDNSAPDYARGRIDAALVAFKSGDTATAGNLLGGVDLAKARSAPAWELAGLLKEHDGDNQGAMETYSQGIASAPSEGLYYRRAILRRDDSQFDLALDDMNHATAHPPLHPVLSNERLLLLLQMGRKDQAAEEMKRLDASSADPAGSIFARCGMALESGEYADAGQLLAMGKTSVAPAVFQQMLKNPVLSRHQSRPEITPFYFSNIDP